jgi:multisubunit Na+/H+ antiporter MnhC subunit
MLFGMTNDIRYTAVPTAADTTTDSTTGTAARRAGRAITVVAAAAGALLLWTIDGPWAGHDLAVRQGDAVQPVGPAAVVVTALVAGLAAWGLLALLERTMRRSVRTYRIIASIVLVLSLAGPLGSGVGTSSRLALLAMHITVGAALIIGLPGRRNHR